MHRRLIVPGCIGYCKWHRISGTDECWAPWRQQLEGGPWLPRSPENRAVHSAICMAQGQGPCLFLFCLKLACSSPWFHWNVGCRMSLFGYSIPQGPHNLSVSAPLLANASCFLSFKFPSESDVNLLIILSQVTHVESTSGRLRVWLSSDYMWFSRPSLRVQVEASDAGAYGERCLHGQG